MQLYARPIRISWFQLVRGFAGAFSLPVYYLSDLTPARRLQEEPSFCHQTKKSLLWLERYSKYYYKDLYPWRHI